MGNAGESEKDAQKHFGSIAILCVMAAADAPGIVFAEGVSDEAAECVLERCWGAVGFGTNGETAVARSHADEDQAVAALKRDCPECLAIKTFLNGCGAMAVGGEYFGYGFSLELEFAETAALAKCSDFAPGCKIAASICSIRSVAAKQDAHDKLRCAILTNAGLSCDK